MTFLDAALKILGREKRPLHFKELTERAMTKKLLTFVGRTPEVSMQQALTAAVKKAPGNPFVRVKPGVFGLLRYPELPPDEPEPEKVAAKPERSDRGDRSDRSDRSDKVEKPEARARVGGDEAGERGRRRRRRGGRGRGRDEAVASNGASESAGTSESTDGDLEAADEPNVRGLSAAARAAALAETGVLEGDDEDESDAEGEELMSSGSGSATEGEGSREGATPTSGDELEAGFDAAAEGDEDGDEEEDEDAGEPGATAAPGSGAPGAAAGGDEPGRRRRRRRRRRGGGEAGFGEGAPRTSEGGEGGGGYGGASSEASAAGGEGAAGAGEEGRPEGGAPEPEGPRRIMTPVDAAIEILRGRPPGRGVHVREIADAASRRRLVHGEPNEAWRVMRAGLAAEPRERLRAGQRPRVRAAGSGLYSLARRSPDAELERAEFVFGEARRALRERTVAGLERRISDLPVPAFEALARVLLQREGFGPATFVKRIESTVYIEALRGRGSRPSRVLIALRAGGATAGRRAVGELRAGIVKRGQDEGLLMLAGRLADDAIAEWKKPSRANSDEKDAYAPPIEIADGQAMAESCVRHGLGLITANVSVDFIDADFFAELAEG